MDDPNISKANHEQPQATTRHSPTIVVVQRQCSSRARMTAWKEHYKNNFPDKIVMALSISQIVSGILSCILQVD